MTIFQGQSNIFLQPVVIPMSMSEMMDAGASRAVSSVYYYKKSNIFGVKVNGKEVVKVPIFSIYSRTCRPVDLTGWWEVLQAR